MQLSNFNILLEVLMLFKNRSSCVQPEVTLCLAVVGLLRPLLDASYRSDELVFTSLGVCVILTHQV